MHRKEDNLLQKSYDFGLSVIRSPNLSYKSWRGFLFGHPISHSVSPYFHQTIWEHIGLAGEFALLDSMDEEDFVQKLRSPDCVGASITMPHKVSCMAYMDDMTEEARLIGAINTVFVRLDRKTGLKRYIGANTDCIGIRDAFENSFPGIRNKVRGKTALVLGAGATTRTAIYTLWKYFEVREIYVVNRIDSEVHDILSSMAAAGFLGKVSHLKGRDQLLEIEQPTIIIGAVPDIAPQTDGELKARKLVWEVLEKKTSRVHQERYLLDMCYYPELATSLIKHGIKHGWHTISAVEPLIHQAVAQDSLWTEQALNDQAIENASSVIKSFIK